MSIKDVTRVIERASSDGTFLNELNRNPERALSGYSLSAEERTALLAGDMGKLEALGVEPRITKGVGANYKQRTDTLDTSKQRCRRDSWRAPQTGAVKDVGKVTDTDSSAGAIVKKQSR